MSATRDAYTFEEIDGHPWLVVTAPWSAAIDDAVREHGVDGLVLNYARGFSAADLGFLKPEWGLKRLDVLDRSITDVTPIERLGSSLEDLSLQAAPRATIDLSQLPRVTALGVPWHVVRDSLASLLRLEFIVTWEFDESDLRAFRDHASLRHVAVKSAAQLTSLNGIEELSRLVHLEIGLAPRLSDISALEWLSSLEHLQLEDAACIGALDSIAGLRSLRFLSVSDCGDIASLASIKDLRELRDFHAWGTTNVLDGDLSVLQTLPVLEDVRMRSRRHYRPRLAAIQESLPG